MTRRDEEDRALRPLEQASRVGALLCGWALLGLAFLTGIEVVGRRFFGFSLQGVDEIGGYVLAITGAFGFSWALFRRGHTRVDLLVQLLGPMGRAALNLLASLSIAAMAIFVAWHAIGVVAETLEFRSRASTPLRTPLIWPQALWFGGLALFAMSATAIAVRALWVAARSGAKSVNESIGPRALREEIEEGAASVEPGVPEQEGAR